MITLSNGFRFEIVVASGALGFDGLGWFWEWPLRWVGLLRPKDFDVVIAKTVTLEPRKGNLSLWHPWTCVRWLGEDSAVNAVGLTNPGILKWVAGYFADGRSGLTSGIKIAASVHAETVAEARGMAENLSLIRIPFIEVNLSCPNVNELGDRAVACDIVRVLHEEQPNPLVVKLSYDQALSPYLVGVIETYCEAFDAINTIPWADLHPDCSSPIESYAHGRQGGVSGREIHDVAVDAVRRLRLVTGRPIIGGGGIFGIKDMHAFRTAGASAFSLGSVFLRYPWRPNRIAKQWRIQRTGEKRENSGSSVRQGSA